jgi:glucose-6-phosphate 1-epimerase
LEFLEWPRVSEGNGGLARVAIANSRVQGELYLHGAQVTSWRPSGHGEVLFLSTKSRWHEGQAIRGGIPVCFPWFRAKADDPHAPAHGFARTRTWQLQSIVQNDTGITVTMSLDSDEQSRQLLPADSRLLYRATFGSELTLEHECTNTGTMPLRFEEALHTYNRVSEVACVRLQGLGGACFLDNTDSNREKTQLSDMLITSPTDNAYLRTQSAVDLIDRKLGRRIRLRKANSNTTVIWNPWREAGEALGDLGDGEWQRFLCVEASNIMNSAVALAPRQEHKMTAALSVEILD